MAHWLYKSEPSVWSWDAQVAEGNKGTHWNGVRNHVANLSAKLGAHSKLEVLAIAVRRGLVEGG